MSKFQRSWALLKCSFRVIFENKRLLLFPIILSLLMIVIVVFFLAPVVLWPTGHGLAEAAHWQAVARQWTVRAPAAETWASLRQVMSWRPCSTSWRHASPPSSTWPSTARFSTSRARSIAGRSISMQFEGAAPGPFDAEQMNTAWKMKSGGNPAV